MESEILYGDIDDNGKDIKIQELQEQYDKEIKINSLLTTEINQLKQQIVALVNDRKQLETNMLTLYNTAKREIKRKDEVIADLNRRQSKTVTVTTDYHKSIP